MKQIKLVDIYQDFTYMEHVCKQHDDCCKAFDLPHYHINFAVVQIGENSAILDKNIDIQNTEETIENLVAGVHFIGKQFHLRMLHDPTSQVMHSSGISLTHRERRMQEDDVRMQEYQRWYIHTYQNDDCMQRYITFKEYQNRILSALYTFCYNEITTRLNFQLSIAVIWAVLNNALYLYEITCNDIHGMSKEIVRDSGFALVAHVFKKKKISKKKMLVKSKSKSKTKSKSKSKSKK